MGCLRSGTTLTLSLVSTCFAIDGACALEMSIYAEPPPQRERTRSRWIDRSCGFEPGIAHGAPDPLFISKKPLDIRIIEPLLRADRRLFALYVVRDPRAVITSVHAAFPGRYFTSLATWLECERYARELEEHSRFLALRFEDLVRDPDHAQDALARRFPFLVKTHPFSEFARVARVSREACEALNGLRPLETARIDGWRSHLPRIKAQMLACGGLIEGLIARGYEVDERWAEVLDAVEPDVSPSVFEGRESALKRLDRRLRDWRRRRGKLARIRRRDMELEATDAEIGV